MMQVHFGNIPAAHLLHPSLQMGCFCATQKLLNRTKYSKVSLYEPGRLNSRLLSAVYHQPSINLLHDCCKLATSEIAEKAFSTMARATVKFVRLNSAKVNVISAQIWPHRLENRRPNSSPDCCNSRLEAALETRSKPLCATVYSPNKTGSIQAEQGIQNVQQCFSRVTFCV
jgi:hypothetical protein